MDDMILIKFGWELGVKNYTEASTAVWQPAADPGIGSVEDAD